MDYSEDEKKAMKMVGDYFKMVEGIKSPRGEDPPSQDKREMLKFLGAKLGDSKQVWDLLNWVVDYENTRSEIRLARDKKNSLESNLHSLLGRPSFD